MATGFKILRGEGGHTKNVKNFAEGQECGVTPWMIFYDTLKMCDFASR
jgi:hypothetical protein